MEVIYFLANKYSSKSYCLLPVYPSVIPICSRVIPPHYGIFRFIPVYSVPFHSVPVFSNARQGILSLEAISTFKKKIVRCISLAVDDSFNPFIHIKLEKGEIKAICVGN